MEEEANSMDLFILPEACIAYIISFTLPRDACRSSLVSSSFKYASDSDLVWEKFLPSDYQEIISRSVSPSTLTFSSKKELYFHLCNNPILIDGGNLSFGLEKLSGKKCYMIGARNLSIVWGDHPQYWRWRPLPESRFAEVAELLSVCWLEIQGKMETRVLSPKTTYAAYLVIKYIEGAYGFNHPPAEVSVRFIGHEGRGERGSGRHNVYMDPDCSRRQQLHVRHRIGVLRRRFGLMLRPTVSMSRWEGQFPKERGDGWMEIEMGEFFNDGDGELEMTLTEVNGGHWKAGLIIQGIELRPKEST